ncbi:MULTISPECIES: YhgE/Pip domain-containing protein [Clostridium]|uniref:ABC-2 family transporter protein n=3 Tax=Clostridium TaxID=1485 RepID=D8GQU9_CLOLD|nr:MULTISPECIES: YhgE/Pip domain-containing protein [Clostridium]ADK16254.1 putative phage infection protein [Clostridium ljungdahlii DSM 13528]AGY75360.1 YhgE/Pip domain-containing protein [Clostridium autoethanogenum DSM 10061]ALU35525.1 Phage infection protein [Clostridium autoethanogenum DSM 10061]OAA89877.1 ABC-2 family transporter protein [Clostridium ljungdahlii DSM 13528]OVY52413.1 ABC-2 family transporter protein [Clostridium autoethanogenum]
MLRNIIQVFKRDMKSIVKNKMTMLIVAGVCILPSLYAWVNIKACWDPYGNTSSIPVAIVNEDKGTNFNGKNLNTGNEIVEKLKDNHKIGWKFVNARNADMGIIDGTYYAMIKIPEDFSRNITSITSNTPKKAEIIYKVNTKNSPVALKITDAARNTLAEQIKSNFIYTVNQTIFFSLNIFGKNAENDKQNIINLKDAIIKLSDNMDVITDVLGGISDDSNDFNSTLSQIKSGIPMINSRITTLENGNDTNNSSVLSLQSSMNNTFDNIAFNLNTSKTDIYRIQNSILNFNSVVSNSKYSNIDTTVTKINYEIDILYNKINSTINILEKFNNFKNDDSTSELINSLKNTRDSLNTEKKKINDIQKQLESSNEINRDLINSITNDTANLNQQLIDETNAYNGQVRKSLNSTAAELVESTDKASSVLKSIQDLTSHGDNSLDALINGSELTANSSSKLNNRLLEFKDIINNLADKLKLVTNNDIIQIITILQNNPDFMGSLASSPFNVKEQNIYTISNFGSSMAPAYTTLSIWIGSIILVSIFKTDADRFKGDERLSFKERYLGKMSTFIVFALAQGFIVAIGDKLLLNVQMVNTFLMIMVALVSSFTFTVITYTLVSMFGNLGKAISIVWLITQIAGSGATYPIQLDSLIFRIMQPLFPFTYSVSGFREAIAGPLISTVVMDFTFMILISMCFILLGIFLKKPLQNKIYKFRAKLSQSGIGD